jgi:hypothetical protein
MAGSEYYDHTTFPVTLSAGSSSAMRAELDAIEAGFGKLPTLVSGALKVVRVNAGETALEQGVVLGNSATKNTGTGSGDVATGNHTHSIYLTETNPVITGSITEDVYVLTGTTPVLEPDNGTIQTWELTAASTPTDGFAAGQSMTLMVADGTAYTITWPSVTWVGGNAPTLETTGHTVIELWKVGSTLYGALVGEVA